MRHLSITITLTFICSMTSGQQISDWKKTFTSNKYGYSIVIPKSFTMKSPSRKNIDFLFSDSYASSILINVTDRLPEEYKITAYNYTKEMLENGIRQASPNYTITHYEKILVDGEHAFLTEAIGEHPKLTNMVTYFFYKDKAYVITCMAETARFQNYKELFRTALKSIKLKK